MVDMEVVAGSYEEVLIGLCLTKNEEGSYQLTERFTEKTVGSIRCVAISDGGLLACGGTDEIIRIFNLKTHRLVGTLNHHSGTVTSLQFTDTHMFSTSEDGTLCLWRISNWEPERTFRGHKGPVRHVGVHPTGKMTLTVGQDKTLRLWNNMTGRISYISNLKEAAELVTWSPDGVHYLVTYKTKIEVYSIQLKGLLRSIDAHRVNSIVFITDTLMVYGGEGKLGRGGGGRENAVMHFVDIQTGNCALQLTAQSIRIRGLAICPSPEEEGQKWLTSVGSDGTVVVYSVTVAQDEVAAKLMMCRKIALRLTSVAIAPPMILQAEASKPTHSDSVQKKNRKRKRKHEKVDLSLKTDAEPSEKVAKKDSQPHSVKFDLKKKKVKNMKKKMASPAPGEQRVQSGAVSEAKTKKNKKLMKTVVKHKKAGDGNEVLKKKKKTSIAKPLN